MADKMTCPSCGGHTSSVLRAYEDGEPCPWCGLSAGAAAEVLHARERGANADLTAKYTEVVMRADKAEAEARRLRHILATISSALRDAGEE